MRPDPIPLDRLDLPLDGPEYDFSAGWDRLQLVHDFQRALARGELQLAYQPKLRSRTNAIGVVEALLRWTHPVRGAIAPKDFIGLAEETGMIGEVTRWVVKRALADQVRLRDAGHLIDIHVNLSGRLVADRDFAAWALALIAEEAVGSMGFEITETAVIADPVNAMANLGAYRDHGVHVAIDDYGAGLSSLTYLKQLPARELKIDRLFIAELTSSHRDPLIVRSTIDLAHALGMEVTAEGVDNLASLALLRAMGCDMIQGYVVSPALGVEDLVEFLRRDVDLSYRSPLLADALLASA